MAMYVAQDGNYGDASGLLIIDQDEMSKELRDEFDLIEDDDERYVFALRMVLGEER